MKRSDPTGPLALPLVRWTGTSAEIHLCADAAQCAVLSQADVVGKVVVEGKASLSDREIVVELRVEATTREICGRSLEEFENPMSVPVQLLLHRSESVQGAVWEEDGEDVWEASVSDDLRELDIEEVLRQAIELERPISPVKPGVPLPPGVLPEEDRLQETTDPRWDALRRLKEGGA